MSNYQLILKDFFVSIDSSKLFQFIYQNFFVDKHDGIFVEIGANDALGATKFFEDLGWKGLAIEPIPELCERIRKERSTKCIQGCIATHKNQAKFLKINQPGPMCLSGIVDQYDARHIQRIKYELFTDGGTTELLAVDCYLFNDVMNENEFFKINYLSLDTEGGELDILKSINFDRFFIDVICVENAYNDHNFTSFLISKDYCLIGCCGCDQIYKKLML